MLPPASLHAVLPTSIPRIVAVGFRRINKLLQELAPEFADRAAVEVLDMGFDQAVARVRTLQRERPVDVIVAAGSNGAYLRQHLDTPVVLVKVGGFDLMQALTHARRLSARIGLVTYEGMAPDLTQFDNLFEFGVSQRSYRNEEEAQACVRELQQQGMEVVVGSGVVADLGCGWGYLSAELLARCPGITRLDAIDADARAVALARQNLTDPRAAVRWADASQPHGVAQWDAVVMNPPFHQGRAAVPDLGRAFIRAAAHGLKPGGRLLLVANVTLPYERELETEFASWQQIDEADGFKLLTAVR